MMKTIKSVLFLFSFFLLSSVGFAQLDSINGDWFVKDKGKLANTEYYDHSMILSGCNVNSIEFNISKRYTLTQNYHVIKLDTSNIYCFEKYTFTNGEVYMNFECKDSTDENCIYEGGRIGAFKLSKNKIEIRYFFGLIEFKCLYKIKKSGENLRLKLIGKLDLKFHELPVEE